MNVPDSVNLVGTSCSQKYKGLQISKGEELYTEGGGL